MSIKEINSLTTLQQGLRQESPSAVRQASPTIIDSLIKEYN